MIVAERSRIGSKGEYGLESNFHCWGCQLCYLVLVLDPRSYKREILFKVPAEHDLFEPSQLFLGEQHFKYRLDLNGCLVLIIVPVKALLALDVGFHPNDFQLLLLFLFVVSRQLLPPVLALVFV